MTPSTKPLPVKEYSTYQPSQENTYFSLREVVIILFRQKWKILAVLCGVMIVVFIQVRKIEPMYESTAKLLIQVGRENMATDPTVMGNAMYVEQKMVNKINNEVMLLKNSDLMKKVIMRVGKDVIDGGKLNPVSLDKKTPEDNTITEDELRNAAAVLTHYLDVTVEKDSYILALSLRLKYNPEVVPLVLETIIDEYQKDRLEKYKTSATPETMAAITSEVRIELETRERALKHFRQTNEILNFDEQKRALVARLSDLEQKYDDARYQIEISQAKIKYLQLTIDKEPQQIVANVSNSPNEVANGLKEKLNELLVKKDELSNHYQAESRVVESIQQQIQTIRSLLKNQPEIMTETTKGINNTREELRLELLREQANLESTKLSQQTLHKEIKKYKEKLFNFAALEIEEIRLLRNLKSTEEKLEEYQESERRSLFASKMDEYNVSSIKIIKKPSVNDESISADPNMLKLIGVFLGIFGGIAFAFLADFLDDTVRTAKEVNRYLKLPVLSTLSVRDYKKCLKR